MKKKMNNKGFSLVELIIVIAIMAVLVAVLAPQYIKFVEKSRESTDLDNIQAMKTAVEAYVADKQLSASEVFTITLGAGKGAKITVKHGSAPADLSAYGCDSEIDAKSADWKAAGTWTYKDYKWDNADSSKCYATYLKCDGSEVGSTT